MGGHRTCIRRNDASGTFLSISVVGCASDSGRLSSTNTKTTKKRQQKIAWEGEESGIPSNIEGALMSSAHRNEAKVVCAVGREQGRHRCFTEMISG